jgi:hypothetical protein
METTDNKSDIELRQYALGIANKDDGQALVIIDLNSDTVFAAINIEEEGKTQVNFFVEDESVKPEENTDVRTLINLVHYATKYMDAELKSEEVK